MGAMGIWDVIVYGAIVLGVADILVPKRYKKRLNDLVAELWFKLSAFTYRDVALKASSRALMYMSKAFRNEQGLVRVKLIAMIFLIAYSIPIITALSTTALEIYRADDKTIVDQVSELAKTVETAKLNNPEQSEKYDMFMSYVRANGVSISIYGGIAYLFYDIFYSIFTNTLPSIALGIISMIVTLQLLERARYLDNPVALAAISVLDLILAILFAFVSMSIVIFLAHDINAYLTDRFYDRYIFFNKISLGLQIGWQDYILIKITDNPSPTTSDISSIQSLVNMVAHSAHELITGNIQIGIFEAFLNYNMLLSLFPTIFHLSLISLLISLKFFDFLLRKPMLFTLEWINGHEKGPVAVVAVLVGAAAKLIERAVS